MATSGATTMSVARMARPVMRTSVSVRIRDLNLNFSLITVISSTRLCRRTPGDHPDQDLGQGIHDDCDNEQCKACLLYTSDAADDLLCVDLGGRRIIKKKQKY